VRREGTGKRRKKEEEKRRRGRKKKRSKPNGYSKAAALANAFV